MTASDVFDITRQTDPESALRESERERRELSHALDRQAADRIQFMEGVLIVDSRVGGRRRVAVTVPLQVDEAVTPPRRKKGQGANLAAARSETGHGINGGPVRVLFVDDHEMMRKSLINLVTRNPAIQVAGEAASGLEAIDRVRQLHPDVVVMDVSMPEMDGIEATRHIKKAFPATRVIGLTMFEDEAIRNKMVRAGAETVIFKSAPASELLEAIDRAGRHVR